MTFQHIIVRDSNYGEVPLPATSPPRLPQHPLLHLHALFQQDETRHRLRKAELWAGATHQSKLAQELQAIRQHEW